MSEADQRRAQIDRPTITNHSSSNKPLGLAELSPSCARPRWCSVPKLTIVASIRSGLWSELWACNIGIGVLYAVYHAHEGPNGMFWGAGYSLDRLDRSGQLGSARMTSIDSGANC